MKEIYKYGVIQKIIIIINYNKMKIMQKIKKSIKII